MHDLALEGDVHLGPVDQGLALLGGEVDGGHADDPAGAVLREHVEVQFAAHHLVDLQPGGDGVRRGVEGELHVLGPDAQQDVAVLRVLLVQQLALLAGDLDLRAAGGDEVPIALPEQPGLDDVPPRRRTLKESLQTFGA